MSCQDDKSSNRSRETAGNRDPGTPPGGAASLTSHGTSAATGKAANQSMPQLPPRVLGSASVSLEISLSRVPSRRSPSAHFFSPGQVLLEPHDCVRRIETSGNGPSILAPRRATPWRHNACAQPKRLDQSLFALWCGGFHRLDSASVGHAVGCCGSTFFVPTTWSALNHNPKRTEYEHNTAELRESGESPSFLSPLPDGHVGVVTAWDAEHFLNTSRTCP